MDKTVGHKMLNGNQLRIINFIEVRISYIPYIPGIIYKATTIRLKRAFILKSQ